MDASVPCQRAAVGCLSIMRVGTRVSNTVVLVCRSNTF